MLIKKRFFSLLTVFYIVLSSIQLVEAMTLHVIIVADTNDTDVIGTADLNRFTSFVKEIEKHARITTNLLILKGNDISPNTGREKLLALLSSLSINSGDGIIFYYTGHGFRFQSTSSEWPLLGVEGQYQTESAVALDEVFNRLAQKKPRFLIAIADACNTLLEKDRGRSVVSLPPKVIGGHAENYKKLFLEYNGQIKMAASSPKEDAYSLPDLQGGAFTAQLFWKLKNELNKKAGTASWESIVSSLHKKSLTITGYSSGDLTQTPLSVIVSNNSVSSSKELFIQINSTNGPTNDLTLGQYINITTRNNTGKAGYLFIWDIASDGSVTPLLPNPVVAERQYFEPSQVIKIPSSLNQSWLQIQPPLGDSLLLVGFVENEIHKSKIKGINLEDVQISSPQKVSQALKRRLKKITNMNIVIQEQNYKVTQ